jgi:hypothetical protein
VRVLEGFLDRLRGWFGCRGGSGGLRDACRHRLAPLGFLLPHFEFNGEFPELFVIPLQEVADEGDEGGPQDDRQAYENFGLKVSVFHLAEYSLLITAMQEYTRLV